jgi:hypothetical protein
LVAFPAGCAWQEVLVMVVAAELDVRVAESETHLAGVLL